MRPKYTIKGYKIVDIEEFGEVVDRVLGTRYEMNFTSLRSWQFGVMLIKKDLSLDFFNAVVEGTREKDCNYWYERNDGNDRYGIQTEEDIEEYRGLDWVRFTVNPFEIYEISRFSNIDYENEENEENEISRVSNIDYEDEISRFLLNIEDYKSRIETQENRL